MLRLPSDFVAARRIPIEPLRAPDYATFRMLRQRGSRHVLCAFNYGDIMLVPHGARIADALASMDDLYQTVMREPSVRLLVRTHGG